MTESNDYMLMGIMILAIIGLLFFIINFIRCRYSRNIDEPEENIDLVDRQIHN